MTTSTATTATTATVEFTYRELQQNIRQMRDHGCEYIVNPVLLDRLENTKLNSKRAVLEKLYSELVAHITATLQIREAEEYLAADGQEEVLPESSEDLAANFDALVAEADEALAAWETKQAPAPPAAEAEPLTTAERVIYTAIVWLGMFLDFFGDACQFTLTAGAWARYGVAEYIAPAIGAAIYWAIHFGICRTKILRFA